MKSPFGWVRLLVLCALTAAPLRAHPPYSLAVDERGHACFLDWGRKRVLEVTPEGKVSVKADLSEVAKDTDPHALALGPEGCLYVAATYAPRIWRITARGEIEPYMPEVLQPVVADWNVLNLCWSGDSLHLVLYHHEVGPAGEITGERFRVVSWKQGAPPRERLSVARGEAGWVNLYAGGMAAAPDGTIYLAHPHAIVAIPPKGDRVALAGGPARGSADGRGARARFELPRGLAVDAQGSLMVADSEGNRLRRVSAAGEVSTLAGSGRTGSKDGSGVEAELDQPYAVAVGPGGVLWVAEYAQRDANAFHRLRRVTTDGQVTTLVEMPAR